MSVITQSKYIYSERKSNVYKEGDQIDFLIPDNNALINTQDTYLVFNIKITGTQYKACVSEKAGVYSLLRSVTISTGDGSTVLETLDHYGILQALKYHYESTESGDNLRFLHEGKPNKTYIDDSSCNQYVDATAVTDPHKMVEVTAALHLSGCLSPLRQDVFPCAATRGLRIKLELNEAATVLQGVKAPTYTLVNGQNQATGSYDGYSSNGYAVVSGGAADAQAVIVLKNADDLLQADHTRILSPNSASPTHLFQNGQWLYVQDVAPGAQPVAYQLNTVEVENNRLKLTLASNLAGALAEDAAVWINDSAAYNDMNFELSEVKMNVGTVDPPPGYLEQLISKVNGGSFKFQVQSYTDYNRNISDNSLNNALPLNCRNTRAKALLSVEQDARNANSPASDSFAPASNKKRQYSYLLYSNTLVPDRPVNMTRYNDGNYDAVCLREQMLALHATGWEVNDIRHSPDHMFYGRRLAMKGYSYDTQSQVTMNVNYQEVSALMMHTFLIHLRDIIVSNDGIAVAY